MKLWNCCKYVAATALIFSLAGCSNTGSLKKGEATTKTQDYTEKVHEYRKAAEQGDAIAQYNLGMSYGTGKGVPQRDNTEAVRWYRKAAEQGHADAQFHLGMSYFGGSGVPRRDFAKAEHWLRKAAEQGHEAAQTSAKGALAVREVLAKAKAGLVPRYRKVAEQGDAEAQFRLGMLYAAGKGVPRDFTEAVRWYRKAAEQGEAKAQRALGISYAYGWGVQQDTDEAIRWYRKAAEQGDPQAKKALSSIDKLAKAFQPLFQPLVKGLEAGAGENVKRYIEASRTENHKVAAAQLIYPAKSTPSEKEEKLAALISKIEEIRRQLGDISDNKSTAMPEGNYRLYAASMIPQSDHPSISYAIDVPVTFTKAGAGVVSFMIGEIDGQKGLYEVQYWCFTCEAEPLIFAAKTGSLTDVKALIANGANVDVESECGLTPLAWAAMKGHLNIVKYLVQKGANPSHRNVKGTPLLAGAAYEGQFEIIKYLIEEADAEIDDDNGSVIAHAIEAKHQDIINYLESLHIRKVKKPVKSVTADQVWQIVLEFNGPSWVNIRDAENRVLILGYMTAGTVRRLEGPAPYSILLGDSSVVEMRINGRPFDLQSYSKRKVAKFSLNPAELDL